MQKSILVALCWILLALVNAYPVDRKNERAILPEEDNELQNSQFHSRISGRGNVIHNRYVMHVIIITYIFLFVLVLQLHGVIRVRNDSF